MIQQCAMELWEEGNTKKDIMFYLTEDAISGGWGKALILSIKIQVELALTSHLSRGTIK